MTFQVGELLEANWDHLPPPPPKPVVPPSKFSLVVRKAMLALRPEFTYGDERDKLQRQNTRRAQRQLERDEAWARKAEKKAQMLAARQKKRGQQAGKTGFGLRKAAGFMHIGDSKATAKATGAPRRSGQGLASSSAKSGRPAAARHGSSNVKIYTLGTPSKQAGARRTTPVPNARVVYASRPPIATSRSSPHASSRPKATARPTVRQAPRSYQSRPTPTRQPTNAPRTVQPWAALQARVVTVKK